MTSDPKEALERLKAYSEWLDNPTDGGNPYEALGLEDLKVADLRTLIAEREGLEREVARLKLQLETTQMQRNSMRTEAEHQGKMRQAAEAQLSALQEVCKPFANAWGSLRDPLPQGPFSISVDANACAAVSRALLEEGLREALKPFAEAHDEALDRYPEAGSAYVAEEARSHLTWADFQAAAEALSNQGKPSS